MALIDKLYNSCVQMSRKATKGMDAILRKRLVPPISPSGIIGSTGLTVTKKGSVVTIETHFPDYAYFVEYGRKAGKKPPIKPIRDWCYLHNLPKGVEWHIQAQIGRRGTKATHFLEPLRRMLEMVQKTMREVSRVELTATYKSLVYSNTEQLKELKVKL